MGSSGISGTMDGALTPAQVREAYRGWISTAAHERGSSYSGSWNMLPSLTFGPGEVFGTERAAAEYCFGQSEKWDNAVAVRFAHEERVIVKRPEWPEGTYVPTPRAVYAVKYGREIGTATLVFPKGVTEAERTRLARLHAANAEAHAAAAKVEAALRGHIAALEPWREDPPPFDPAAARRDRAAYPKAKARADAAQARLDALCGRIAGRLYAVRVDRSVRWLIAGNAAS